MKKYILLSALFVILGVSNAIAQDYHFGIRAGLNYSKFLGAERSTPSFDERFSLNNGLHFGVTWTYNLTDNFGFGTELAYSQIGSKYSFKGDSYYVFDFEGSRHPLPGIADRIIDVNNSYISIPAVVSIKPIDKIEIQAGVYAQFLILSTGAGKLTFNSPNEELEPYYFSQSMDANYYSDDPQESVSYSGTISVCLEIDNIGDQVCPDDQTITMPKVVGAYYEYYANDKDGSLYNWFDAGLTGSISYFINKSLYARVTTQYGLRDVTNNRVDVDYSGLDENGQFIFQQDKDVNFNIGISLGFKF